MHENGLLCVDVCRNVCPQSNSYRWLGIGQLRPVHHLPCIQCGIGPHVDITNSVSYVLHLGSQLACMESTNQKPLSRYITFTPVSPSQAELALECDMRESEIGQYVDAIRIDSGASQSSGNLRFMNRIR